MRQQALIPYYVERDEPEDFLKRFPIHLKIDAEKSLPVANKYLQVGEVLGRLDACRDQLRQHATIACAWLDNRYSNERNICITSVVENRRLGWHGQGECLRAITQVSIW